MRVEENDAVYVYISQIDAICKAIVSQKLKFNKDVEGYAIKCVGIVDQNGRSHGVYEENTYVFSDDMWYTPQEAYEALEDRHRKRQQIYCSQITSVKDLLNFPFIHNFYGDYRNEIAIAAYKQMAKELLNVDIDG